MKTAEKTRIWAELLMTVCTLLLAILLIFECLDAYRAGTAPENLTDTGVRVNDIFTPEGVRQRFNTIAWAFWLWLAAFITAVICRLYSPPSKTRIKVNPEIQLALVTARRETTPAMRREERLRRCAAWVCAAVCLLCAVMSAVYLLDITNFTSRDLEPVMGAMMQHAGPFVLLAFISLMIFMQVQHGSLLRELTAAKEAPQRTVSPAAQSKATRIPALRILLYIAALALIIAGIANGGMYDVLVKAVNICTECVGLG